MKIIHKIGKNSPPQDAKQAFLHLGVSLGDGFNNLEIAEDDPIWPEVEKLVTRYEFVHSVHTEFERKEIEAADFLVMMPTWHHGYPEPSDDRGYIGKVYDFSDRCNACGIGKKQIAPFRMKKEPAWGAKNILQLNWILDEYFVKPAIREEFFKSFGIDCLQVVLDKSGAELTTVVQLIISDSVPLTSMKRFKSEVCLSCGKVKYLPIVRGYKPRPIQMTHDIAKSEQYFGSGGSANRRILVSQKFYAAAKAYGLKGVYFDPCEAALNE